MVTLDKGDVREILKMLENELNLTAKVDKIEKMKMRSSIRKQANWLLGTMNPTADRLYNGLEDRLPEVFSLYPYGFCHQLRDLLDVKLLALRKREKEKLRLRSQSLTS
jgi:hypothetical protein